MSPRLQHSIEWDFVTASKSPEIRATWCRFGLTIDGKPVTRVIDHRAAAVRDHVFVPLYPVTEWIVAHWWPLLNEVEGRPGFAQRHLLRLGREGYAFPELSILPSGPQTELRWSAREFPPSLSFVTAGSATIDRDEIAVWLTDWVDSVVTRLEQQGLHHTPLQDEWRRIQHTTAEEVEFCLAAGELGLDPYAASDEAVTAIVDAAQRVPTPWQDEFFCAATVEQLASQANAIGQARSTIEQRGADLSPLSRLRQEARGLQWTGTPWQQGYQTATWLRAHLGLREEFSPQDEALGRALGLQTLPVLQQPGAPPWMDAAAEINADGQGAFVVASRYAESQRFAFGRALCDVLTAEAAPSALVTSVRTSRQKRNRAFAAELLAPAPLLRRAFSDEPPSEDHIAECAHGLGVSTELLKRQLQNHGIAAVMDQG